MAKQWWDDDKDESNWWGEDRPEAAPVQADVRKMDPVEPASAAPADVARGGAFPMGRGLLDAMTAPAQPKAPTTAIDMLDSVADRPFTQAQLVAQSREPGLVKREAEEATYQANIPELKAAPKPGIISSALDTTLAKPLDRSLAGLALETAGDAARGVAMASKGVAGSAFAGVQAASEHLGGPDSLSALAGFAGGAARESRDAVGNPNDPHSITQMVFQSTFTNVPVLLALGAGGGALAAMGAIAAGNEYGESRDRGAPPEEAIERAAFMGVAEMLGERVGLPALGRLFTKALGGASTKELSKALADHMFKEQVGEQVTTALQSAYEKAGTHGLRPDMTLADYIEDAVLTAKVTLGQSLLMGGGASSVRALHKRDPLGVRQDAAAEIAAEIDRTDVIITTGSEPTLNPNLASKVAFEEPDTISRRAGLTPIVVPGLSTPATPAVPPIPASAYQAAQGALDGLLATSAPTPAQTPAAAPAAPFAAGIAAATTELRAATGDVLAAAQTGNPAIVQAAKDRLTAAESVLQAATTAQNDAVKAANDAVKATSDAVKTVSLDTPVQNQVQNGQVTTPPVQKQPESGQVKPTAIPKMAEKRATLMDRRAEFQVDLRMAKAEGDQAGAETAQKAIDEHTTQIRALTEQITTARASAAPATAIPTGEATDLSVDSREVPVISEEAANSAVADVQAHRQKKGDRVTLTRVVAPPDESSELATQVAAAFGRPVVFVTTNGATLMNAAVRDGVFVLNTKATDAAIPLISHELVHTMPDDIKQPLIAAVRATTTPQQRLKFLEKFSGYKDLSENKQDEELTAMFAQAESRTPAFWSSLADKMGDGSFAKLARHVLAKLDTLMGGKAIFKSKDFTNDIKAVREALTTAYAETLKRKVATENQVATSPQSSEAPAGRRSREAIRAQADAIAALSQGKRDNMTVGELGGADAYNLYEARKLAPKPSDKLKKVNDRNSFNLANDYDAIANVDGELFGVNKREDPDDWNKAEEDATGFIYAFTALDDPIGKEVGTMTSDAGELVAEIRRRRDGGAQDSEAAAKPKKRSTLSKAYFAATKETQTEATSVVSAKPGRSVTVDGKKVKIVKYPKAADLEGLTSRLHARARDVLSGSAARDFLETAAGALPGSLKIGEIRGLWAGEREDTFTLRMMGADGKPLGFAEARKLSNMVAFAFLQEGAVTSSPSAVAIAGVDPAPAVLITRSDGAKLERSEVDAALAAANKAGFYGASEAMSGKGVKFTFFPDSDSQKSEQDQYLEFHAQVSKVLQSTGYIGSEYKSVGTLDGIQEYWKNGTGRSLSEERAGEGGNEGAAEGSLDLFRGIVDNLLAPYIAAIRIEGFEFDAKGWQRLTGATKEQLQYLTQKTAALDAANKHGIVPKLRQRVAIENIPQVGSAAVLTIKTTAANAERQLAALDDVMAKAGDPTASIEAWLRMNAIAYGTSDVPMAPARFIEMYNNDGIFKQMEGLSPGQVKDADHGFANAAEFRRLYESGSVQPAVTAKLMLWSFLSRGVSPYVQESAFVDLVSKVAPFTQKSLDGAFSDDDAAAWSAIVSEAIVKGSGQPGAGTTHNANAFGGSFMRGMAARMPDGRTKMKFMHDLFADPTQNGRSIRREFIRISEGVGIDNKVISFTLLVIGHTDVAVLDRVQIANTFNDGRLGKYNLYDGVTRYGNATGNVEAGTYRQKWIGAGDAAKLQAEEIAQDGGGKVVTALLPGSGMANLTTGARGLLIYEPIELALDKALPDIFRRLKEKGLREESVSPSVGRWHWESWVAYSGQEASHKTLDALLNEVRGDRSPFANVPAKEGEYGAYNYGVEYARGRDGVPYKTYATSDGATYKFSLPAFNEFVKLVKVRKHKIVPAGFKVSVQADKSERTEPWFNDPRVNRANLDALIRKFGVAHEDEVRDSEAEPDATSRGREPGVVQAGGPAAPSYGTPSRNSVRATAWHFSQERRGTLSSAAYGRGLRGSGAEQFLNAADPRSRQRVYFYVDKGQGIHPEAGVGGAAHEVNLQNLYDGDADPLKLKRGGDWQAFETGVMDAGFDGYLYRAHNLSAAAVLIGKHAVPVAYRGLGRAATQAGGGVVADTKPAGWETQATGAPDFLKLKLESMRAKPAWAGHDLRIEDGKLQSRKREVEVQDSEAPVWYSQLQSAFAQVPDRLATMGAKEWAAWLKANASKMGVKQDEIAWSGIEDYLALRGKDKISREELAAWVGANGVRVEEVVLGDGNLTSAEAVEMRELENIAEIREQGQDVYFDGHDAARLEALRAKNGVNPQTKYGQYQLPGGTNYKEVLLTLPSKPKAAPANLRVEPRGDYPGSPGGFNAYLGDKFVGWGETEAAARAYATDNASPDAPAYKSNHWDTPNVLAHIRLNDRTNAYGARVLFVEEIQSDWGQAAKKKGVFDATKPFEVFDAQTGETVAHFADQRAAAMDAVARGVRFDYKDERTGHKVPPAPFVTKTNAWVALALKRVIKMAVDGGYDRVAFINGEQSADRYDLSKQIDAIDYRRVTVGPGNEIDLHLIKDGSILKTVAVTPDTLEDHVGKDMAKKILAGEGVAQPARNGGFAMTRLAGLDLKVGGEGMMAFYDQIVPQVARDVLKKLGGAAVYQPAAGRKVRAGEDATLALAPTFDITPAMREKAEGGVPMFSDAPDESLATDGWILSRDELGRFRFGAGAKLYRGVADIANRVLNKLHMKPISKELGRAMRQMKVEVAKAQELTSDAVTKLNDIPATDREMISDVIERELAAGVNPPAEVLQMAATMSAIMSQQADEMVRLGMLSQETADHYRGQYLPRFYENKVGDLATSAWEKAVRAMTSKPRIMTGISGKNLKRRGQRKPIDAKDLPQYLAMGWTHDDPKFDPATDTRTVVHRDFTRAEREDMGEIRDAMFRFAMGHMRASKDIALGRLFEHLAADVASRTPVDGWVEVPRSLVQDTKARTYGKLAGMYVPSEVMDHLTGFSESHHQALLDMYRKGLAMWKEGKALALDTPIPTPTGWTTMGELSVGDTIFDESGKQCQVTFATEVQHGRKCYRVEFSDGESIVADEEHLWFTAGQAKPGVRTTKEISDTLKMSGGVNNRHSVPVAGALELPPAELPVDPYFLGAWLGNGTSRAASMTSCEVDSVEMMEALRVRGFGIGAVRKDPRGDIVSYQVGFAAHTSRSGGLQPTLRNIGVLGNKHIPMAYLRASEGQRLELLRGLMDTDGTIDESGKVAFCTAREELKDGFVELARSLGFKPRARSHMAKYQNGTKHCWHVRFHATADQPVFNLPRKAARLAPAGANAAPRSQTRQIVAVAPVESVPVRCIQVSSESRLYLAGDGMIPTHNTVLNPVAHANNVLGNLTAAHFGGVSYWDTHKYIGAIRDLVKGDPMVAEARDNGLFIGTFSQAEMLKGMPDNLKVLAQISESRSARAIDQVWSALALWLRKPAGVAYEAEDQFFRYLLYRDARKRGVAPQDAVDIAQMYIFTYDDLPAGAKVVRDVALPFFSYTYKAVPMLAHTAMNYPWRYAAPVTAVHTVGAMMYAIAVGADDDDDWRDSIKRYLTDEDFRAQVKEREAAEKENLPPWMKGSSFMLGVDKTVRLGTDDLTNLPVFLDISRIFPGGDMLDMESNAGGVPWPQPLMPSNPMLTTMVAMLGNKDMYFGKEIVNKRTDTAEEAALKRGAWLWRQFSPAVAVNNYHWTRGMNVAATISGEDITWWPDDATGVGRDGLPVQPKYAAMQTFGIKARPIDLDASAGFAKREKEAIIRELDAQIRGFRRRDRDGSMSSNQSERAIESAREKKERLRDGLDVDGD